MSVAVRQETRFTRWVSIDAAENLAGDIYIDLDSAGGESCKMIGTHQIRNLAPSGLIFRYPGV